MKNWRKWGGVDKFLPHFGGAGHLIFVNFLADLGGRGSIFCFYLGGRHTKILLKCRDFFGFGGGLDKSLKKWGGCRPKAGKMVGV